MKELIKKRIQRLRKSLSARKLDATLITSPQNRFYFSGFDAEDLGLTESAGALLITRRQQFLLTDGRYQLQAKNQAPSFEITIYKKGLARELGKIFQKIRVKSCAFEPNYISCSRFNSLKKATPDTAWHELGDICQKMRLIKDNSECIQIAASQRAAEKVFQNVVSEITPGRTEKEIAFLILQGLYTLADGPSFPPIVASGPNSALPHAVPSDRTIQEGEPVIVDMGARLGGYCSDMTRTIFCGAPSDKFRDIYKTVRNAQKAAQMHIRPGQTGKQADGLARKVIEDAGYGNFFVHSLGHGVGIAIHEAPLLSPRSAKKLQTGMVFTVEPGIYVPEEGGVRLENMGILRNSGLEIMTSDRWFYDF